MLPEISRRCPSCRASVRDAEALFCAECGKPLATKDAGESSPAAETAPSDAASPSKQEPAKVNEHQTPAEARVTPVEPPAPSPRIRPVENPPPGFAGKTRETLHRASAVASAAARGVMEEPAKRVEQIRHASTHVIEEASYDPSLRFVLVALALFIVFIILLVLSKVMG